MIVRFNLKKKMIVHVATIRYTVMNTFKEGKCRHPNDCSQLGCQRAREARKRVVIVRWSRIGRWIFCFCRTSSRRMLIAELQIFGELQLQVRVCSLPGIGWRFSGYLIMNPVRTKDFPKYQRIVSMKLSLVSDGLTWVLSNALGTSKEGEGHIWQTGPLPQYPGKKIPGY